MEGNYRETEIDGVKVRYIEYPGPSLTRFRVSMLIEGIHIEDDLICPLPSLENELRELVFINKIRRKRYE